MTALLIGPAALLATTLALGTGTLPAATLPRPAAVPAGLATPSPMQGLIPADTAVELVVMETISSRVAQRGQFFSLQLREPIRVGNRIVVPAGAAAVGQVVHADHARFGGKAGELIVAARFLRVGGEQVPLRASFGQAGASRMGAATAATIAVGALGLLVHGRDTELPAGTPVSARLAVAWLPPLATPAASDRAPATASLAPVAAPQTQPPTISTTVPTIVPNHKD